MTVDRALEGRLQDRKQLLAGAVTSTQQAHPNSGWT